MNSVTMFSFNAITEGDYGNKTDYNLIIFHGEYSILDQLYSAFFKIGYFAAEINSGSL